jgi:splicing factor 3B subunit 3
MRCVGLPASVLELDENEAAVSLCLLRFSNWPDEGLVLAVGTVQGLTFYPRQSDGNIGLLPFPCC